MPRRFRRRRKHSNRRKPSHKELRRREKRLKENPTFDLDQILVTIKELGINKDNIDQFLTLSKKEIFLMLVKKHFKNFSKMQCLFEDLPPNCFSDPRKDLNDWSLRQVMLLLCNMEMEGYRMAISKKEKQQVLPWEKIDSPREGAETTWKVMCNMMPKTMGQAIERVRTLAYTRAAKKCWEVKYPSINQKRRVLLMDLDEEMKNEAEEPLKMYMKDVYDCLSPLGRTIFNVRMRDKISQSAKEFLKEDVKNESLWHFR